MKHIIFALFENAETAEETLQKVDEESKCSGDISVVMRDEDYRDGDLKLRETAAKTQAGVGLLLGGVGGALLGGLVAGPLGLVGFGALFTAMMGGTYGSLLGGLGGFLGGSSKADPRLQQIADKVEKDNYVLVSVTVESLECEEHIAKLFQTHGAAETHRNFG